MSDPALTCLIAKLVEVTTEHRDDPFGPVSLARAKVRGPLCRVTLSTTSDPLYRESLKRHLNRTVVIQNQVFRGGESFLIGTYGYDAQVLLSDSFQDKDFHLLLCQTRLYEYDPSWGGDSYTLQGELTPGLSTT